MMLPFSVTTVPPVLKTSNEQATLERGRLLRSHPFQLELFM